MHKSQKPSSSDTLKAVRPSLRSSKEGFLALIDSHCHLHDKQFFSEEQAEAVLKRAREAGVGKVVCIGTDPEDSMVACEFAAQHDNVYWTYGIHPEETSLKPESVFSSAGLEKSGTSYTVQPAGREKSLFSERPLAPVVTGLGRSVFATSANMLLGSIIHRC